MATTDRAGTAKTDGKKRKDLAHAWREDRREVLLRLAPRALLTRPIAPAEAASDDEAVDLVTTSVAIDRPFRGVVRSRSPPDALRAQQRPHGEIGPARIARQAYHRLGTDRPSRRARVARQ
jgi:hypothetical protein